MRFRTDFVTNSSSSSFIISFNNKMIDEIEDELLKLNLRFFKKTLIEHGHYYKTKEASLMYDEDDLINVIGDEYLYPDCDLDEILKDERLKELYERTLVEVNDEKKTVMYKRIDYDEDFVWELLKKYKELGFIEVINESEC